MKTLHLGVLFLIYTLSRLPFLRSIPVFYDSFEYADIAQNINIHNLSGVIISSHQPFHTFYFLLILIFKKLLFFSNPQSVLSFISFTFGLLTVIVWYQFIRLRENKSVSFFSTLLIIFFPYFFVVTTNILYEAPLLFFQLSAFYLLYLSKGKNKLRFLFPAGVLYGFSVSIFIGSLLLLPVYFLCVFIAKPNVIARSEATWQSRANARKQVARFLAKARNDSLNREVIIDMAIFFVTAFLASILIDLWAIKTPHLIYAKYLSHFSDWTSVSGGYLIFIYRIIRNIWVQGSQILSFPAMIVTVGTLVYLGIKKKLKILLFFLIIGPAIILTQYWHAGLFGRLAIYIIFPVSYFLSVYYKTTLQRLVIFIMIFLFTARNMAAQYQPAPIYSYYDLYKKEPGNYQTAVITSDYNRFLYERNNENLFVVKDEKNTDRKAEDFIDRNLYENKTVLIDSAGLAYPYFQFDGDFFHPLSLSRGKTPLLTRILNKYETKFRARDTANKEIYFLQIVKK